MSEPLRILIVEDEFIIAEDLAACLEDLGMHVHGICDNVTDALANLQQETIDLVLLDVNLEQPVDGIHIAALIRQNHQLPFIFLTAFTDDRTVQRASETEPYGYIVKPFEEDDLRITIELAMHKWRMEQARTPLQNAPVADTADFFIKTKSGLEKIVLADVLWVEAYDNYSFVHVAGGKKHLVSSLLKEIEERLPTADFIRVHRSYIVRIDKVERIEHSNLMIGAGVVPMSKSHREEFMARINQW